MFMYPKIYVLISWLVQDGLLKDFLYKLIRVKLLLNQSCKTASGITIQHNTLK